MPSAQRRGIIFTALGILLALVAAIMAFSYVSKVERQVGQKTQVVVARENIEAGAEITEDMIRLETRPVIYVPDSAYRSLDEVVGSISPFYVQEGDLIYFPFLHQADRPEFEIDETAISIAVDNVTGVGGLIQKGDLVNVVVSYEPEEEVTEAASAPAETFSSVRRQGRTFVLFQNVRVLSVDKAQTMTDLDPFAGGNVLGLPGEMEPSGGSLAAVTLALTMDEATQLAYAANFAREVRLTLRQKGSVSEPKPAEVNSLDDLRPGQK